MKKKLILLLCLPAFYVANGQTENQKRGLPQKVENAPTRTIKPVAPNQVKTLPASTSANTAPPPPAPAVTDLGLSIRNVQINHSTGNMVVAYSIRNNGTTYINTGNLVVQGYINDPLLNDPPTANSVLNTRLSAGGHIPPVPTQQLSPGQEYQGTLNFTYSRALFLYTDKSYTYTLIADESNKLNESTKSNNTAHYNFRGLKGQAVAPPNASQYFLRNAFVTIKTGADNKEPGSSVGFSVLPSNSGVDFSNTHGTFIDKKEKREFKSNSTIVFPLAVPTNLTAAKNSLASINQNGLGLLINYQPGFGLDAWKVDGVSLRLEFKDANGSYHPSHGVVVINFNIPPNTFLDGIGKQYLVCKLDGALHPLSIKNIHFLSEY